MTKIRKSAKDETCSLRVSPNCSHDEPGKVVLCHLNSNHRGIGIKSHDLLSCYGCYNCHLLLDASKVSYEDQQRAHFDTLMKLIDKGLVNV